MDVLTAPESRQAYTVIDVANRGSPVLYIAKGKYTWLKDRVILDEGYIGSWI